MPTDFLNQYVTRIPGTFELTLSLIAAILAMFFIISLLVLVWVLVHHQIKRETDAETDIYFTHFTNHRNSSGRSQENRDNHTHDHTNQNANQHASETTNQNINRHRNQEHTDNSYQYEASSPSPCYSYEFHNLPRHTTSFIGQPALLDNITRLIRHTCPQSRANQTGKCGLCLQDIAVSYVIRTLPCGHSFHNLCVLRWLVLLRHMRCPDCDQSITS